MTTVRITDTLRADVKNKLQNMERTELNRLIKVVQEDVNYPALTAEVETLALKQAWGEHYGTQLQTLIPHDWCYKPRYGVTVRIKARIGETDEEYEISAPDALLPPPYSKKYSVTITIPLEDCSSAVQQLLGKFFLDERAVREKYKTIREQIMSVFDAVGSLNAALKRAPAIALYIPESYRDRVEEKVVREKREEADMPVIDNDLLSAVGVTHALGG